MTFSEQVKHDYARLGLSLKTHPLGFLREKLTMPKAMENRILKELPDGARVKVAGLVLMH